MPDRPDKNYKAPKSKINQLASAYFGAQMGNLIDGGIEAKGTDVNPGGIAQGLDEGSGEGMVNYGPPVAQPPSSVLQSKSANIQAPPSYEMPHGVWGTIKDIASGGRFGANTAQANAGLQKLYYEGQVRDALAQQDLINKLIAQEQQGRQGISLAEINNRAKADLESQTITGRDNSSRLNTALANKYPSFNAWESSINNLHARPDYTPTWEASQLADLNKPVFENANTQAKTQETIAGTPGKAYVDVGPDRVLYNPTTSERIINRPAMSVPPDNIYKPDSFRRGSFREIPGGVDAAVGAFGPMASGYKFPSGQSPVMPSPSTPFTPPQQNPIKPSITNPSFDTKGFMDAFGGLINAVPLLQDLVNKQGMFRQKQQLPLSPY